jgi:hypothetical protein
VGSETVSTYSSTVKEVHTWLKAELLFKRLLVGAEIVDTCIEDPSFLKVTKLYGALLHGLLEARGEILSDKD